MIFSLVFKNVKAMYFAFYKWLNYFFIRDQTFSNFLARTISVFLHSVTKCHSVRFSLLAYLRNAKPILSLRRLSSDQPAQIKCKTNSGSGSASNSRVFQPQWLKQLTGSSMMRRQSVCSAEHECINLGQ